MLELRTPLPEQAAQCGGITPGSSHSDGPKFWTLARFGNICNIRWMSEVPLVIHQLVVKMNPQRTAPQNKISKPAQAEQQDVFLRGLQVASRGAA
jgi:hypothetical protein